MILGIETCRTIRDKYKTAFDPEMGHNKHFVGLWRDTYWIRPSGSSSMYPSTTQLSVYCGPYLGLMQYCVYLTVKLGHRMRRFQDVTLLNVLQCKSFWTNCCQTLQKCQGMFLKSKN